MSKFSHINDQFRENFRNWSDLLDYLRDEIISPEFPTKRALRQILMADLSAMLVKISEKTSNEWVLSGSISLPTRTSPMWRWDKAQQHNSQISDGHLFSRSAFDLDITFRPKEPMLMKERQELLSKTVKKLSGLQGLGGLVTYDTGALKETEPGQIVGIVTAAPTIYTNPLTAEPINIELDIKPPRKAVFEGEPTQPIQSLLGFNLPGFKAPLLPSNPNEWFFADKVSLLVGKPRASRRISPLAPWHRYKDIFDLFLMTRTLSLSSTKLKQALDKNWSFERMDRDTLPRPYRVYGNRNRAGDWFTLGEPPVNWIEGCKKIQDTNPELIYYPSFPEMEKTIGHCLDTLPNEGKDNFLWNSGSWKKPTDTCYVHKQSGKSRKLLPPYRPLNSPQTHTREAEHRPPRQNSIS